MALEQPADPLGQTAAGQHLAHHRHVVMVLRPAATCEDHLLLRSVVDLQPRSEPEEDTACYPVHQGH